MEDTTYVGPYRATRLWNDVILAFRQYLPCGRHRRYMKTFDNCFSGSSASEWLLQYLKTNGNFGTDVSREKAMSLLNKLYRAGIFEEVRVSKTMRHKPDVQENRLYKFSPISPSKMKITRLPLAPRNDVGVNHLVPKFTSRCKDDTQQATKQKSGLESDSHEKRQSKLIRKMSLKKDNKKENKDECGDEENYSQCHLVTRVLTTKEIKDTWTSAFILRCKKVLGVADLADVISTDLVNGYHVMHNCIYLNKSGVVTNIDAKDQLPHWVMSAMKCLARWPEPPEPGLPSYPGFEKDVFGVVKDYFLRQEEPLVPYSLYDIITNVFVVASSSQPRHSSPRSYSNEYSVPSSLWSSLSLENIILNLTRKYCMLDSTGNQHGSTKDLLDSASWFGTQEDLRFTNYNTHSSESCHQSVIASTDKKGMQEKNQAREKTVSVEQSCDPSTQEPCRSMSVSQHNSRSLALLRKTQSGADATEISDRWLSGISRKFGSVPNLKVSRFETAFGPDNRTVTRVFYQNGMTTDIGHDVDESSFIHEDKNADKAKSTGSLYNDSEMVKNNGCIVEKPVIRSKSFVDAKKSTKNAFADETARDQRRNMSARSSSFNENNSFNFRQQKINQRSPGNNSNVYDCDDKVCSILQSEDISCQSPKNVVDCDHSESTTSSLHNTSTSRIISTTTSQEQNLCESQGLLSHGDYVSGSLNQSYPSQLLHSKASSYLHVNTVVLSSPLKQPADNYNIECKPSAYKDVISSPTMKPSHNHDLEYKHSAFSEEHLLSSEAANRSHSSPNADSFPCHKQLCDPMPLRDVPSSTSGKHDKDDRSLHEAQETGYIVVLDASKKQSVLGWTNLTSQHSSQSCINLSSQHSSQSCINLSSQHKAPPCPNLQSTGSARAPSQITSTPCLPPHCDSTASTGDGFSSLSLSGITPFYSRNSYHRGKDSQRSLMSYPQTRLAEDRAKNSLQMITLLLPPANRRKLHFLFKMMMKMTLNPNLCLDPSQTTRSLVIGTFYSAIIRSPENCELDEVVQLQLVSFMLDYYDEILTPPPGIKTQVSDRLKALQRPQVVYSPKPERTVRFCQQTSITDFENQRISTSQTALENLLEGIVSDEAMHVKEKTKRLKQFQRMYPAIYSSRFPDAESEARAMMVKVKVKQPLIARPLNKLKGLRL